MVEFSRVVCFMMASIQVPIGITVCSSLVFIMSASYQLTYLTSKVMVEFSRVVCFMMASIQIPMEITVCSSSLLEIIPYLLTYLTSKVMVE